jgi:hypothetical protein
MEDIVRRHRSEPAGPFASPAAAISH